MPPEVPRPEATEKPLLFRRHAEPGQTLDLRGRTVRNDLLIGRLLEGSQERDLLSAPRVFSVPSFRRLMAFIPQKVIAGRQIVVPSILAPCNGEESRENGE